MFIQSTYYYIVEERIDIEYMCDKMKLVIAARLFAF